MVDDQRWMREALALARLGRGRTAPNPVVGACIVTPDGSLVGRGITAPVGGPHAEVQALDEAGARARGATLYCTLEPCAHVGRTGPCTARIITAGITRVVVAMGDPFPLVRGRGLAALRAHGIEVAVADAYAEAVQLNRPYLRAIADRRPFVVLKAATSLDGCIAAREGVRTPLTSAAANYHAHLDRAQIDGIAVGSETVLVDDPLLTARGVRCVRPLARVVFDRRLRTPASARLFSTLTAGPVIILTSPVAVGGDEARARALEDAGAIVVPVEGESVIAGLRELVPRGIHSLILEGGAAIHHAAWRERVVDFVSLYIAPVELGAGGVPLLAGLGLPLAALDDVYVETLGPDVVIEGYVHRAH